MTIHYHLIAVCLLLPSFVYAGCFSSVRPVIDVGIESDCFKVNTHGCIGVIQIKNHCNEIYYVNNAINCEVDFSAHDELYFSAEDKKHHREVAKTIIDGGRLAIQSKFSFDIYVPQEKVSVDKLLIRYYEQESTQNNAVKLFCDIGSLKNNNFVLNFSSNNDELNVAGHYKYVDHKYQKENFIVNNLFMIFFTIILIYPAFWLLSYVINKIKKEDRN